MTHRFRTTLLLAVAALLAACDAPTDPRPVLADVLPGLLATVEGADGTTFRATGTAFIELKGADGTWTRAEPQPWKIRAEMVDGVGVLTHRPLPEPDPARGSFTEFRAYLKQMTPIVAIAGNLRGGYYTGYALATTTPDGQVAEMVATPGAHGQPITQVTVRAGGQILTRTRLEWTAVAGGYVLTRQTSTLFRDGAPIAVMVGTLQYDGIDPLGLIARVQDALGAWFLPEALYAQTRQQARAKCAWNLVTVVVGFGGLLITTPAAAGATAAALPTGGASLGAVYGWLTGWLMWGNRVLVAVATCDAIPDR